jgi:hypothetical protein
VLPGGDGDADGRLLLRLALLSQTSPKEHRRANDRRNDRLLLRFLALSHEKAPKERPAIAATLYALPKEKR